MSPVYSNLGSFFSGFVLMTIGEIQVSVSGGFVISPGGGGRFLLS